MASKEKQTCVTGKEKLRQPTAGFKNIKQKERLNRYKRNKEGKRQGCLQAMLYTRVLIRSSLNRFNYSIN